MLFWKSSLHEYHITPIRMSSIQQTNNNRFSEGVENLCTAGGDVKWCYQYGKEYNDFSKRLIKGLPYDQALAILGI